METAAFPFRKLRLDIYIIIDVMMYVKYKSACLAMFSANKETRAFLNNNATAIINGFTNDGLI
jgi:hypothetical protein